MWDQIRSSFLNRSGRFCIHFDVLKNALVDAMNQKIAPHLPLSFGRHFDFVPRAALEARAVVWQRDQPKFASPRPQIAMQMRWRKILVGAQLAHRVGRTRHVECEPSCGLPRRDRLDKTARRKDAAGHTPPAPRRRCVRTRDTPRPDAKSNRVAL